ncbi:uncharacterized protein LOC129241368 [Anastrepha obliqua]|uniref:uncharacterized protein LOC129241368 n=1 Tax=Anastrepha obliqua TaxID=95512 RepID=UPI00240A38A9|nr:uncharacterized protein LOC129241368 [Anastrepha obliqua]
MEKLKIKTIGVLREREGVTNGNGNGVCRVMTLTSAIADSGGNVAIVTGRGEDSKDDGGGGGTNCAPTNRASNAAALVRQMPKMSALDLAGIINCKRRLEWTKEWLKKNQTEFLSKENLRKEIQFRSNEIYHFNCFFDITERQFRYLVNKLSPVISSYEPHRKKKSFSAEERIAITLKYLATGEVHSCRNYCFRASKPVILKMIANICLNIYELLKDLFVSLPKTDEQWQNVANEFQRKHCMPNCAGHLAMQQIRFHSSSRVEEQIDFINKQPLIFTSIVDSNNNFLYTDIEKTQAVAFDEIYEKSTIRQLIETYEVKLPVSYETEDGVEQSYYFASKCGLPLKPYLLNGSADVPKDSRVNYNNIMNMVNRHTENALRMLANIFPILSQPLRMDEENGRKIILGCVALYNFLRKTDRTFYKQTEKITLKNDWVDDDCILVASEEEHGDNEELSPKVTLTSCFQNLHTQKGDSLEGVAKREYVIRRLSELHAKLK